MIEIFLPPLMLITILVMIHTYFGRGILERGIIFTDLAIAQSAAFGSALSLSYFHGEYIYLLTLVFALSSAFLIAFASTLKLQLEAFIGILYVLGASGIMMVLANSAEGVEHFKALLASDILFTQVDDIVNASIIYMSIALVLFFIYPRLKGFLKELLFFTLLAITVTSSVKLAGVLVVFSLLVAPALVAKNQSAMNSSIFANLYGWILSYLAIYLSYTYDLPTGYTIVFTLSLTTLVLILLLNISTFKKASST